LTLDLVLESAHLLRVLRPTFIALIVLFFEKVHMSFYAENVQPCLPSCYRRGTVARDEYTANFYGRGCYLSRRASDHNTYTEHSCWIGQIKEIQQSANRA